MIENYMKKRELIKNQADSQTCSTQTDAFLASWINRISPWDELRTNPSGSGEISANWDDPKDTHRPSGQYQKPSGRHPAVKALPNGNERILVVDDDPSIVRLEEDILSMLGYHVVSKTDSVKALALFQENPERFDLVITDMNMPVMEGDRLALKLLNLRSDIPIIMCSGSAAVIDEETMKSMGLRGYIIKPLRMKMLAEMVRQVLDSE